MLINQITTHGALLKEGLTRDRIKAMSISLSLFPTPFKKIYYIPSPEERKASIIDNSSIILTRAVAAYLGTKEFYYSCRTAEERLGIVWHPIGQVHIINCKLSRKIDLEGRIRKKLEKNNYRAKRIAKILSLYGNKIIFHKVKSIKDAKFKETPYGRFAMRSQIKMDKKRFREF